MLAHLFLHRHAGSGTVTKSDMPMSQPEQGGCIVASHALGRLGPYTVRCVMLGWHHGLAATRAGQMVVGP
jgi:hypothetical protein